MKLLLDDLYQNKNLSHHARWSLAIYLHKIGKSKEEILNIFSNSPDFNLNITEYQVEYIISKDYSMPSCTTLKTYGLCITECGCFNPIKYIKRFDKNE
jgi:DNA primase large subunit